MGRRAAGADAAPDFASFFDEVVHERGFDAQQFEFVNAWWPLRRAANVHLVHFSALKRAPERAIRALAEFLGFTPPAERWPVILECCSFPWMKARQERFEAATVCDVPVLNPGAMIRKGKLGAAAEDGMTDAIAARVRALGERLVDDPRALAWHYGGGPLP